MLECEVAMMESANSGSLVSQSDITEFKEERSRLLDNPTLEHCKRSSSPNEEHYNTEKVYTSIGAQMDFHCHDMSTSTGKVREVSSRSAKQKLLVACVLVILFIILEVIGGIVSQSLAIMADAAHMLSDFASLGISLVAIYLGERPVVKRYNFGYRRAEVIGALLIVVIIWIVTGVLVYLAIHRLRVGDYEIDPDYMMLVAGCAVLFNIILGLVLHGVCRIPHGHSHGSGKHNHIHSGNNNHEHFSNFQSDSESDDDEFEDSLNKRDIENVGNEQHINIRAAIIHVLGDFLQSVGVLISSVIIKFQPEYKWADPCCTILFSVIVFCTTIPIVRDTIHVLLEGYPKNLSPYDKIYNSLLKIEHVTQVHGMKVWSLTINHVELICHLGVLSEGDNHPKIYSEVLENATTMLRKKYDIRTITIQVETVKEETNRSCLGCQPLKS